MEYPKEPFDFKLFILKMLGKWYQFVLWTIVGSVIFGGCYYLYKVVYAPAREYQASATYYIEYAKDPTLKEPYSYFNEYTLDSWLTMDAFTGQVLSQLTHDMTAEELNEYITLIMASDVRMVTLQVMTSDPVLAMEILKAYDKAFVSFAEAQREIKRMVLQDMSEDAVQIKADIRTQRAFVLGAVLGLFAACMYIMLKYLLDDGIYLPLTLEKRHGLKVLGADISEELAVNVAYAVRGSKRVAVTGIGEAPALPEVLEQLKAIDTNVAWVCVPSMTQCPEAGEVLRGCDGVIVTVVSGADKSGSIDRTLAYYRQQDVKVIGAILWKADEALLKRYEK